MGYNVTRKFTADQYAVYKWLGCKFTADQYAVYKWLGCKYCLSLKIRRAFFDRGHVYEKKIAVCFCNNSAFDCNNDPFYYSPKNAYARCGICL